MREQLPGKPRKILILAGSAFQVPLIERAKQNGHYVITCDYLPSNPGHKIADEYHNVSTTDKEAVLQLARDNRVDGVTTISSDPAMPTVAYVAAELGLPGPTVESVADLTEKDRFRALLSRIGLNVPQSRVVRTDTAPNEFVLFSDNNEYVVKPVDSSGSKGVTICGTERSQMACAVRRAIEHSRVGRCIIEEYINGHQVHGDGYVENGRLIYSYLGDHVFYTRTDNLIPVSTRWPCTVNPALLREVTRQVQAIVTSVGYERGPINIEARITPDNRVFIVEVGPRNGGNFVPIIQHKLTGFDFLGRIINDALGLPYATDGEYAARVGAHYILHADRSGRFAGVSISHEAENYVFFRSVFKRHGDPVERFVGSNATIGVLLLQFDSVLERDNLMNAAESHFRTCVS